MEFGISRRTDRQGLYFLWQKAFKDGEDFIDKFFSAFYSEEKTFVCRDKNTVVSMLFLIRADIISGGEKKKAFYVYAAATDEKYRGRGIMSSLLKFAGDEARKKGADFLFLHPASRSLYNFYEKNGFSAKFYYRYEYIERNSLEKISFQSYNYVKWGNEAAEFNSLLSGGKAFKCKFGYADVKIKGGVLYIDCFCSDTPVSLLNEVMKSFGFDGAYVNFPPDVVGVSGRRVRTGMLLSLNGGSAAVDNIYLGITLE